MFNNKILLITGGTGSFGMQVLEKFIDSELKKLDFSRDELKQDNMRKNIITVSLILLEMSEIKHQLMMP